MKIPLLDLKKQYALVREETEKSVRDVLESQYFIGGKYVTEFEEAVAEYSGVKHAGSEADVLMNLSGRGDVRGM